ncbi:MAG: hypothetical protein QM766_18770 [Burkholderiaceae bacterium]
MKLPGKFPAFLLACTLTPAVLAADSVPAGNSACELVDRNDGVALLVCPHGLDNEALRQAGTAACHSSQQCKAWVWNDRSKVPDKAPVRDADIPESSRRYAAAIWVNESQGLITLRRLSK